MALENAFGALSLEASDSQTPIQWIEELRVKLRDISEEFKYGFVEWFTKYALSSMPLERFADEAEELIDSLQRTHHDEFLNQTNSKFNLAFLLIFTGNRLESSTTLNDVEKEIEKIKKEIVTGSSPISFSQKSKDHFLGFELALNSLKNLYSIQFVGIGIVPFARKLLKPKGKAILHMLESKFSMQKDKMMELFLINKAISEDENWEWHLSKLQLLRWERMDRFRSRQYWPNHDEIEAVNQASRLNPDHPPCRFRVLQLIGDYSKTVERRRGRFPVMIGGLQFDNADAAATHFKNHAVEFCEETLNPHWMNALGKIFISVLPAKHVDMDVGEKLIRRALSILPNDSTVNHRLGCLLMQKGQISEADDYLKKAVHLDQLNLASLLDYVKVQLRYEIWPHHLEKYFRILQSHHFYKRSEYSICKDLKFLYGVYLFNTERHEQAVRAWLQWAYSVKMAPTHRMNFASLGHMRKYGWRRFDNVAFATKAFDAMRTYVILHGIHVNDPCVLFLKGKLFDGGAQLR